MGSARERLPSGKYRRGQEPPEGSRIAGAPDELEEAWKKRAVERNWRTLEVVGQISEETGKSYARISLNWLLRQPGVIAPILGVRCLDQIEDNLDVAGWKLSEEQVSPLSEASAPPDIHPYDIIRDVQRV